MKKQFKDIAHLVKNPDYLSTGRPGKLTGLKSFAQHGGFPRDSVLTNLPREMVLPLLNSIHQVNAASHFYLIAEDDYSETDQFAVEEIAEQEMKQCHSEDYVLGSQSGQDWVLAELYQDIWLFIFEGSRCTVYRYDRVESWGDARGLIPIEDERDFNNMLYRFYRDQSYFKDSDWFEITVNDDRLFR